MMADMWLGYYTDSEDGSDDDYEEEVDYAYPVPSHLKYIALDQRPAVYSQWKGTQSNTVRCGRGDDELCCVVSKQGFTTGVHVWDVSWDAVFSDDRVYVGVVLDDADEADSDTVYSLVDSDFTEGLSDDTYCISPSPPGSSLHPAMNMISMVTKRGDDECYINRMRIPERFQLIIDFTMDQVFMVSRSKMMNPCHLFSHINGHKVNLCLSGCSAREATLTYIGGTEKNNPVSLVDQCRRQVSYPLLGFNKIQTHRCGVPRSELCDDE